MSSPDFMAIVGPTASGKTRLSMELGARLEVEIISMDSRQVYRGMDIGTGKVGLRERSLIPHHGLDLIDPDQRYSAGQFARDARRWIRGIRSRGRVPLLVGGTGFFLKSLTHPMFREPALDRDRLERLRAFLNGLPPETLAEYVRILDPERAGVAREGRQRATRTVEIALLSGRPLSWWHQEEKPSAEPLSGLIVLLDPPRDGLYEAINRRVGEMVAQGLADEVALLLDAGYGSEDPGMTGAGYGEMVSYLTGQRSLPEAADDIRRAHRRYARRQSTWFRHQLPQETVILREGQGLVGWVERILLQWSEKEVGAAT